MSRYQECLRHAKAYVDNLKATAEAGKMNSWVIEGMLSSYLDQPGFEPGWRRELHRDALGEDWAEWRSHDYRVGRPRNAPGTNHSGVNGKRISGAKIDPTPS